jgi:transposase-like protein
MINYYLEQTPPQPRLSLRKCQHLILDATFLHRPRSLIALMDAEDRQVMTGQYPISENSESQLTAFFERLIQEGLHPLSFTVDGNPNVIRVLRQLWPGVTIQRCLIHIQRQGLSWCRAFPKTPYARKLRRIFLQVASIRSQAQRDRFLMDVREWEDKYSSQIRRRPETGRVFSDVKRARSMLLRALPDMFHYLDDPHIPISTNGLESYFSRLKTRYRQHRGLSKQKRANYFQWYFYFVPK